MEASVSYFIPLIEPSLTEEMIKRLRSFGFAGRVFVLATGAAGSAPSDCEVIVVNDLHSSASMKIIADKSDTDYAILHTGRDSIDWGLFGLERMVQLASEVMAPLTYADRFEVSGGVRRAVPVIDYQFGSLRDDFDFGPVLLFNVAALREAVGRMGVDYRFAGLYDLRLKLSQRSLPLRVNEPLYIVTAPDAQRSGERQFDYVDPKNRAVQLEMEHACTEHLKAVGGYLAPQFQPVDLAAGAFETEASVIIPVRNRIRTVRDAIRSALSQQAPFPFNVIVVDNHSTDGTTQAIDEFDDDRLVHVIPERTELGIGGCWNVGVHHAGCGRFAVQLDSDDVYKDETALASIVRTFRDQACAMVVGSYALTDIELNMKPGGVIDHREWTPENGRNNALRINGLGAPRAFFTPLLRAMKLPNTSYGEDYAAGLRFSRHHQIGRLYDVVYLCRRWEGNSDASPDVATMNAHNVYKDRIRTVELQARIALNRRHGA